MIKIVLQAAVFAVLGTGCMTYDFDPVAPVAFGQTRKDVPFSQPGKPNIMVLLDKSGSMARPINAGDTRCAEGCGLTAASPCDDACPTRISELRAAMAPFLAALGAGARFGLAAYPTDSVCGDAAAPARTRVPLPANPVDVAAELSASAAEVNASIQRISATASGDDLVIGGTPTGGAVRALGEIEALSDPDRRNFVLLLTDGLPNCNAGNPANCIDAAACQCTLSSCGTNAGATFCTLGCLDDQGAPSAIASLRAKGIQTVVVGFGAETAAANAQAVLRAMAEAGGFTRPCTGDSECGTGGCDVGTRTCNTKLFQAATGAELADALRRIADGLPDACVFALGETPQDPTFLTVRVDGQSLDRGPATWRLDGSNVTLLQGYCDKVKAATRAAPVQVSIRFLERL